VAPAPDPSAADPSAPEADTSTAAPDPAVEAFIELCSQLAGFDERLHGEWVDGYLTAVAASWRAIALEEVLDPMCGDAFTRAFADPEDDARARRILGTRLEALRAALDPEALLDDPDMLRLQPWMAVWDDASRAALVEDGVATAEQAAALHTGQEWAVGFLQATVDFAADWPDPRDDDEHAEAYTGALETVAALAWDPASPEFAEFARAGWKDADPTRDELIDEACFAVQDLRLWWIDHAPRQAPRRVDAGPGRNDPCPCGSGRKYKKCHGAAA
jgi:uncharacterized protein